MRRRNEQRNPEPILEPREVGERNFDRCSVRRIEFETFVPVRGKSPADDDWLELNTDPQRDPRSPKGYKARVECPRTEDDGIQIASPNRAHTAEAAVSEVRDIAALVACGGCAYACKTPAVISQMRGELAGNEVVRMTNQRALNEARLEVEQVEARVLGTGAVPALPPPSTP